MLMLQCVSLYIQALVLASNCSDCNQIQALYKCSGSQLTVWQTFDNRCWTTLHSLQSQPSALAINGSCCTKLHAQLLCDLASYNYSLLCSVHAATLWSASCCLTTVVRPQAAS